MSEPKQKVTITLQDVDGGGFEVQTKFEPEVTPRGVPTSPSVHAAISFFKLLRTMSNGEDQVSVE